MFENIIGKELWGLQLNYQPSMAAFDYTSFECFRNDNAIIYRCRDEYHEQRTHDNYAAVIAEKVADHRATATAQMLTGS